MRVYEIVLSTFYTSNTDFCNHKNTDNQDYDETVCYVQQTLNVHAAIVC